ncbi:MAG: IclR family transcriptional regulator [Deltaproteobacteria bacterium]|nr:IclR family transcriptional regulator [Deltaproteobacteria bacterium]
MAKPKSEYSIQTVSNALRMLEAFYQEDELGVSELSRRLSLHKNNVFRLLATLEQRGYIEQSPENERYRLGTRCLELGQAFSRRHTLLRRARPILEELVRKVGETAHIAVIRDFEVVHLDGVLADQMVLTTLRVGHRLPVHCTALGKVLVGCSDAATQESFGRSVVAEEGLASRTESTIADPQKLFDELRTVSAQGFALDLEECEPGMRCVAAPVRDCTGSVIAAISISGPGFRLAEESLHGDIGRRVVACADQLSQELGHGL